MTNFILLLLATISWDANMEADLMGYRVYYGQASRGYTQIVDVGNINRYRVDLPDGQWFFAVTAYDTADNESGYSAEVNTIIGNVPVVDSLNIITATFFGDAQGESRGFVIYGGQSGFMFDSPFASYELKFDLQLVGEGSCLNDDRLIYVNSWACFADTTTQQIVIPDTTRQIRFEFMDDCWLPNEPSDANIRIDNIWIIRRGKRPMGVEYFNVRLK